MKTFDINIIRNFRPRPCYDPGVFLPEDWSGTAMDILNFEECPPEDRLWVVLNKEILDAEKLHLIACDCAESVLPIWGKYGPKDERFDAPKMAIDAKRRWVKGECTDDELTVAYTAANVASRASWAAWANWAPRDEADATWAPRDEAVTFWITGALREAALAARKASHAAAHAAWADRKSASAASASAKEASMAAARALACEDACVAARTAGESIWVTVWAASWGDQIKIVKKYL